MTGVFQQALDEIGAVTARIDDGSVDRVCRQLADARRIVVYGCGREALQVRGFAMRLFHMGLDVAVVGEMTCPPVAAGDVFLATSGPGETSTVLALVGEAKKAGARVVVLTAAAEGSAAKAADDVFLIPGQTMLSDQKAGASAVLPMGSVFEGALFVLFEVMVLKLRGLTGETSETMRARHTNLE